MADDEEHQILVFDKASIGAENFDKLWKYSNEIGTAPTVYAAAVEMDWYTRMNFCGCGDPESTRLWLLKVLRAIDAENRTYQSIAAAMGLDPDGDARYFILYTLDAMGLTEHGGSVNGCWLTDEGKQMIKNLESEKLEGSEHDTSA